MTRGTCLRNSASDLILIVWGATTAIRDLKDLEDPEERNIPNPWFAISARWALHACCDSSPKINNDGKGIAAWDSVPNERTSISRPSSSPASPPRPRITFMPMCARRTSRRVTLRICIANDSAIEIARTMASRSRLPSVKERSRRSKIHHGWERERERRSSRICPFFGASAFSTSRILSRSLCVRLMNA